MNKIFKVRWDGETDTIFATNKEAAIEHCIEYNNIDESYIEECIEIPESIWDSKCGVIYEDNNAENEPYDVTYRELYSAHGSPEIMVSTNIDWL